MTFSNKIENPKTPISGKSGYNDIEILRAALSTEKNLGNTYTIAMHEASHEKLYTLIFDMLKETSQQHRKLLNLQFQHGWLSLTPTPTEEVTTLEHEFNDAKQQLQ